MGESQRQDELKRFPLRLLHLWVSITSWHLSSPAVFQQCIDVGNMDTIYLLLIVTALVLLFQLSVLLPELSQYLTNGPGCLRSLPVQYINIFYKESSHKDNFRHGVLLLKTNRNKLNDIQWTLVKNRDLITDIWGFCICHLLLGCILGDRAFTSLNSCFVSQRI